MFTQHSEARSNATIKSSNELQFVSMQGFSQPLFLYLIILNHPNLLRFRY